MESDFSSKIYNDGKRALALSAIKDTGQQLCYLADRIESLDRADQTEENQGDDRDLEMLEKIFAEKISGAIAGVQTARWILKGKQSISDL